MKFLLVLTLLQTVLLLVLFGKILGVENRLLLTENPDRLAQANPVVDTFPSVVDPGHSNSFPNEFQLRQIIREELGEHRDGQRQTGSREGTAVADSSMDVAETRRRYEQVEQQLNYFSSVGSISEVEMQKLQGEIATLDKESRREMLGRLTRALNSGELEGRL